ncbi:sensor domain-containing diguanylate cyclase [Pseudokineococcus basanitobsidens]|uniref:Sensor domain-containing diguanylate cyclase n=1 Tax=Pseudokineococcus basanitobsidens TaxID=1926649 RepID=A0ABU8RKL6_9ACTN
MDVITSGDRVPALLTFERACALVLDHLASVLPMGLWAVTQREAASQVFLSVRDEAYGVPAGAVVPWDASLCQHMTTGASPQVVADVGADPVMAGADARQAFPIEAYVGAPIRSAEGELFGTLCGFNPHRLDAAVEVHRPLLDLLASLLSQILQAEGLRERAAEREVELHRRATTDDLTGLATRAAFTDRLDHALALHRRDPRPLTVVMLDLDDFKDVNDSLGHEAGDELLRHLADEWAPLVRPGDTLARLGGDEFALLVHGSSGGDVVAARLGEILAGTYSLTGTDLRVGVSVGVAHLAVEDTTPTAAELLRRADAAMYAAKRAGKGRIVTHDEAVAAALARLPRPTGVARHDAAEVAGAAR